MSSGVADNPMAPLLVMRLLQFYVDVDIGSPPQRVPLVVDSTIKKTIVPSVKCYEPSCIIFASNGFNPSNSTTFASTPNRESITVADYVMTVGNVLGHTVADVYSVAGVFGKGNFVLADEIDGDSPGILLYNGRLGLGHSFPEDSEPSFLPSLLNGRPKVISMWSKKFSEYGISGGITFGGYNPVLVIPGTWVTYKNALMAHGLWGMIVDGFYANGVSIGFKGAVAIDVASPFVTMPVGSFNTISYLLNFHTYGKLQQNAQNGGYFYNIPCQAARFLPNATIVIDQVVYQIPATHYLLGDGIDCVAAFYGLNLNSAFGSSWVFGSTILQNRLVAFDWDSGTISWGHLNDTAISKPVTEPLPPVVDMTEIIDAAEGVSEKIVTKDELLDENELSEISHKETNTLNDVRTEGQESAVTPLDQITDDLTPSQEVSIVIDAETIEDESLVTVNDIDVETTIESMVDPNISQYTDDSAVLNSEA